MRTSTTTSSTKAAFLALVASLLALALCANGQGVPSSAVPSFSFGNFTSRSETQFGIFGGPIFGPTALTLLNNIPGTQREEFVAVWYLNRVHFESFNVSFNLQMSNLAPTGLGNSDGFALVFQNASTRVFGAGLGYGITPDYPDTGIRNSVAIEFDTYLNENLNDPTSNHISVHTSSPTAPLNNADESNSVTPPGPVSSIPPIAGYTYQYFVQYLNNQLSVYMNNTLAYQATLNIPSVLSLGPNGAYIGLTTSCNGPCENILVNSFSYNYISVLSGSKSFVNGIRNNSIAGQASYFNIQTVDTNGYYYQSGGNAGSWGVTFTPIGNAMPVTAPTINIDDMKNGQYVVSYTPTWAGLYRVSVTYNSQTLYSTPFTLSVIPGPIDAANCVVSGSTTGGVAGQTLNLSIIGKDAYNNINYNNNPAASFTASLGGQSFVSTFVGNGTYRIPYSFTTAGTYSLSVVSSGSGQAVQGSPFSVTITPALPYAANSVASGTGTVGGTAGTTLSVSVSVYDMYKNLITSSLPANYHLYGYWDKRAAGANLTAFTPQGNAFVATYTINTSGTYHLNLVLGPNAQPISGSPFAVVITPQTTPSAAQSVAYGPGLRTASAGSNATFTVQARDAFGNNMTTVSGQPTVAVSFTTSSGVQQAATVYVAQNPAVPSLFSVSYATTHATVMSMSVTLNGAPISGSPFSTVIQPGPLYPPNCFAQGLGLTSVQTNTPLTFVVITVDAYDNRLTTGGARIAATLVDQKSGATVVPVVTDLNNGGYNLAYTLTKAGNYSVTITANGTPIGPPGTTYSVYAPSTGLGTLGWTLVVLGGEWRHCGPGRD
jgi:hypothetical protein